MRQPQFEANLSASSSNLPQKRPCISNASNGVGALLWHRPAKVSGVEALLQTDETAQGEKRLSNWRDCMILIIGGSSLGFCYLNSINGTMAPAAFPQRAIQTKRSLKRV